jgi:molybdopterin converting factor small subunit
MAVVFLPFPMRKYAAGARQVKVPGRTLGEVIANLEKAYPGMSSHLLEDGKLKPGLTAVVGTTDTREGLMQAIAADTEVHFIPRISGGLTTPVPDSSHRPRESMPHESSPASSASNMRLRMAR